MPLDYQLRLSQIAVMEPANEIIKKFGGVGAVASITGVTADAVYRWPYPKKRGGCDGWIPAKHHTALVEAARKRGIKLEYSDFHGAR